MRIIVTTGLFPPDIGGPATHAADLAEELRARGHSVTVLTLGTSPAPGVVRWLREQPWPRRTAAGVAWLVRHRREYDLVYDTGLPLVAVPGARLAGRPVVLKVVGDAAWERGRLAGLTDLGFEEFQQARRVAPRLRLLRAQRDWTVRRVTAVITPGRALAATVEAWVPGRDVRVVPNGVRAAVSPGDRQRADGAGVRFVAAGRLVVNKRIDVLLEAIARVEGVALDVIGEGPEQASLERQAAALGVGDRVAFLGARAHNETLARLAEADALVAPSEHEGLPHVAIEALVHGTPVVCAATDGMLEVVVDGKNGLVFDPPDATALAAALARLRDDGGLRDALRAGAAESGVAWRFDGCADALEAMFEQVAGDAAKPRAVFVGKTFVPDPPPALLVAKYALHARLLDQLTVSTGRAGRRTIAGVRVLCFPALRPPLLGGALFYALAPPVAVAAALRRRPSAIICQSPYEAAGVAAVRRLLPRRLRPPVQVELHGDWRAGPRHYGSPARRAVGPVSDRVSAWAVRQATRVRAVSDATEALARDAGYVGPVERHLAYSGYDDFLAPALQPLPERPQALFVGALERSKAIDVLLDAWAVAAAQVPGARLVVVGTGSMAGWLQSRLRDADLAGMADRIEVCGPLPQRDLVALIDQSTCLVLPSRSEGQGRVAIEAMARARPVVASHVGGLVELVRDGVNGRLVPPEDIDALAGALADILASPEEAARMGRAGRRTVEERDPTEEYAAGIRRLAAWIVSGTE